MTITQFALTPWDALHIIKMMKPSHLSRVENLLRRVVEEPFTWLGGGAIDPFQLATYLSRFYDERTALDKEPNHFVIAVNPDDYREIESDLDRLERQVADYVVLLAGRRSVHLSEPPRITIEANAREKARSAHITVAHDELPSQSGTAVYFLETGDATQEAIQAADAFLIVQGRQHVPLDRPIIRIGRRVDNDIVLDAPSISRQHAQIRWRQRYFVLYDVSSHGRTYVNGNLASEHILRPGDVIALSDLFLVYGEGREGMLNAASYEEQDGMDSTMLKPEE